MQCKATRPTTRHFIKLGYKVLRYTLVVNIVYRFKVFSFLGPSGSGSSAAEPRASSSRSPGKTVIVRAVSRSTYLGDFFLSKLYPDYSSIGSNRFISPILKSLPRQIKILSNSLN